MEIQLHLYSIKNEVDVPLPYYMEGSDCYFLVNNVFIVILFQQSIYSVVN